MGLNRSFLRIVSHCCLAGSVLGSALAMAQAQQQFLVAPHYAAGGSSYVAAVGDFNKDGKLDVVAVSSVGNVVSVMFGKGDGTFQPNVDYGVGANPYAVVVGDFNGDGNPDLAVTSFGGMCSSQCESTVSILLGNGDGTFRPRMDFATGGLTPFSIAAADFNGDGKLDLVIANGQAPSNAISLLFGNGDGTFQPPVNYMANASPGPVAVGDFNGDGKPDLAVVSSTLGPNNTYSLSVLINKGDGTFQAPVTYATADVPSSVVVADLNSDGKPDLVVICTGGVSVLLGNGNGTFQPHLDYITGGSPSTPGIAGEQGSLVVADFNGDGKPDIALTVGFQNLVVGFGNGDGTFQAPIYYVAGTEFFGPSGLVVGDFNGDRKPDLVVGDGLPHPPQSTVSVLLNDGKGGFHAGRSFALANAPQAVALADLNGDGKLDLVIGTASGVAIMLGNGDGTFRGEVDYSGGGTGIGDFNGDGILDLTNGATALLGKGDGTFGASISTGAAAGVVAVGDFNGDGKLDLAVIGSNVVSVVLGNGDGTFKVPVQYATGLNPVSLAAADFNGDSKPDLAVTFNGDSFNPSTSPGGVDILINRGDGTFLPAVVYSTNSVPPTGVAVGDFNGDGRPDLAVATGGQTCRILPDGAVVCSTYSGLLIYLGNGDGTLQAGVPYTTASGPSSVVVADFNGDGKPDLATANPGSGTTISLLWGNGDGTFRSNLDYHVGSSPVSLAAGDLNDDSKPDLTIARAVQTNLATVNAVTALLNTASGPANVLSVSVSSAGPDIGGTVSSKNGEIVCGPDCNAAYAPGTSVTVLDQPIAGYDLTDWSGDCTGTGTCVVDMNSDHSVVANFSPSATLPPDFSIAPTSTSLSVQRGGQVTDVITVAPLNGVPFGSAIQLSCVVTGPTPMPACALSPTSVTPGANSAASTLTITAPAAAAALTPASYRRLSKSLYALWLPLMLGITLVGGSKKLRRAYWVLGGLLVLVVLQVACGGSNNSSGGGTPTNYTVTVTSTSGAIQHTTQVAVTVQ
jgi:FG-GAP-like repeat/Divergent InlB B-repeat domain